jgi:hypothetical protein
MKGAYRLPLQNSGRLSTHNDLELTKMNAYQKAKQED